MLHEIHTFPTAPFSHFPSSTPLPRPNNAVSMIQTGDESNQYFFDGMVIDYICFFESLHGETYRVPAGNE